MLFIVFGMVLSLVAACAVVLYVAYPHRGQKVPGAPWLGDALGKAVSSAPVLAEDEVEATRRR